MYGGEILQQPNSGYYAEGGAFLGLNAGKISHKHLYHMLMGMNKRDWEAVRESANRKMGGGKSSMWRSDQGNSDNEDSEDEKEKGKGMAIAGGYNYSDMKDVLLCPNPAAAGRLLELEHDAGGAGFKSALHHALRGAKKIAAKTGNYLSNPNTWKKVYDAGEKGLNILGNISDAAQAIPFVGEAAKGTSALIHGAQDLSHLIKPAVHQASDIASTVKEGVQNVINDPQSALQSAIKTASNKEEINKLGDKIGSIVNTAKNSSNVGDAIKNTIGATHEALNLDANQPSQNSAPPAPGAGMAIAGKVKRKRKASGGKMDAAAKKQFAEKMKASRKGINKKDTTYGGMKDDMPKDDMGSGMAIAGSMCGHKFVDPRKRH